MITQNRLYQKHLSYLESGENNFEIFLGSGCIFKNVKFDGIHVGATADSIPIPLINSLKTGGVLLIPLANIDLQIFCRITRLGGVI